MLSQRRLMIDSEVKSIGLTGIFISIENIQNKNTDANFEQYRRKILQKAYQYIRQIDDFKSDYVLNGFRQLHESVGEPNRKNFSAPENLYKQLLKNRTITPINLLVDIYNAVSVNYKLALCAHDWDKIDGNVQLRFTNGTEKFIPLGENTPKQSGVGVYSYIDDSNEIICYLDVRQCEKTKVTLDTKHVFIVVQGNSNTPFSYIEDAASELLFLIKKYCGGTAKIVGQIEDFFYDYQI